VAPFYPSITDGGVYYPFLSGTGLKSINFVQLVIRLAELIFLFRKETSTGRFRPSKR